MDEAGKADMACPDEEVWQVMGDACVDEVPREAGVVSPINGTEGSGIADVEVVGDLGKDFLGQSLCRRRHRVDKTR